MHLGWLLVCLPNEALSIQSALIAARAWVCGCVGVWVCVCVCVCVCVFFLGAAPKVPVAGAARSAAQPQKASDLRAQAFNQ